MFLIRKYLRPPNWHVGAMDRTEVTAGYGVDLICTHTNVHRLDLTSYRLHKMHNILTRPPGIMFAYDQHPVLNR